jgi:hypothetical protein
MKSPLQDSHFALSRKQPEKKQETSGSDLSSVFQYSLKRTEESSKASFPPDKQRKGKARACKYNIHVQVRRVPNAFHCFVGGSGNDTATLEAW